MKYRVVAHLDFDEDVLELDEELYEYVMGFFDWNYREE